MKYAIILFTALMVGCSTFEKIGDFVSENQLLTSIAVRQAVSRYISAGDTIEKEDARALAVETRLERIIKYLDGNPKATADQIIEVAESSIDWEQLEISDQLLVMDLLSMLKKELESKDLDVNPESLIAIRSLFETAISAARVHLMK